MSYIASLVQLGSNLPPLYAFLRMTAAFTGLAMLVGGLFKVARNEHRGGSVIGGIAMLIGGSLLISIDMVMQDLTMTMFGVGQPSNALSYSAINAGNACLATEEVAIDLIQILGLVSIIRGIYMLASLPGAQYGQGRGTKGIVHVIGGICAVNIQTLAAIMAGTIGVSTLLPC